MKQIFLLVTSDAKWLTHKREEIIDQFVPREMRDENLREILCAEDKRAKKLDDLLPDIIGELSTIPFLPDSRRVLVVHDLPDFMAGGRSTAKAKAKAASAKGKTGKENRRMTALETFIAFARRDLASTNNILIFSTLIEYDHGEYLDEKGPLIQFLKECPLAEIPRPPHREQDPLFSLQDALLDRNPVLALRHFRAIYNPDNSMRIFRKILETVRFLLQSNILAKVQEKGLSATRIQSYLPEEKNLNFQQQAPFVQNKFQRARSRFQLRELMQAMDRLLEINENLIPSPNALYVPDKQFMIETFIVEFCTSGN